MGKKEKVESIDPPSKYGSKYKYLILIVLCLVAFISVYPQFQMTPMAEEIKDIMHIDTAQYSVLFSAPMFPAIFISLICGIIVDRFGARWPMMISLIIGSVGLWTRAFVPPTAFWAVYFSILVLGLTATFGNSSNARMFGEWFSPNKVSLLIGIYMACSASGGVIANATTQFMPSLQFAYIVAAVLITIVAVLWILFYRNNRPEKKKGADQADAPKREPLPRTLLHILKCRDIIISAVANMCGYGALMCVTHHLSSILQEKGIDPQPAGILIALLSVGQLCGNLIVPLLISKIGHLRRYPTIALLLGVGTIIGICYLAPGPLLYILIPAAGFLFGGTIPIYNSMAVRIKRIGKERAGTAQGLVATFQLAGAVLIPSYIVTPIAGSNYTLLLLLTIVFAAIAIVLPFFLSKEVEGA